jgi:hypothetical protein
MAALEFDDLVGLRSIEPDAIHGSRTMSHEPFRAPRGRANDLAADPLDGIDAAMGWEKATGGDSAIHWTKRLRKGASVAPDGGMAGELSTICGLIDGTE